MDKKKLSVAIIGSRGIPNRYGGFEALAEELSGRLVSRGHQVLVYTPNDHPLKDKTWNGVERMLISNPERKFGTFGQFIYDLNCNLHSRKRHFDIILHLGYTSDSIWYRLWKKDSVHLVNMDGQEWARSKYSSAVKAFLRLAERLATLRCNYLVADSPPIEKFLTGKYHVPVRYIAYGAAIPEHYSPDTLQEWGLTPDAYDLVVARMEPENNIEMAIRAKLQSGDPVPLMIIGNDNKYRQSLQKTFGSEGLIIFRDGVYDRGKLDSLRHFGRIYIHGHSVGGTNPSLLEAMACGCRIVSHDNPFNRYVLGTNAFFFSNQKDLEKCFIDYDHFDFEDLIGKNLNRIKEEYNWNHVTEGYEKLFYDATGI